MKNKKRKTVPTKGRVDKHESKKGGVKNNSELVIFKNQINDKLTKINLATAIVAILGVAINSTLLYKANQRHTNHVYFQVDQDHRIVEITPVSEPNQSVPATASWLKTALEETFHMNFYDYKERLSMNTALYFTEEGGRQLISALERGRSLELMEEREMWLSLTLDNPVFIKRGMFNGTYRWHFQVRGQLSMYNIASRGTPEQVVFDIYIDRMNEIERERGLGISRLVMDRI